MAMHSDSPVRGVSTFCGAVSGLALWGLGELWGQGAVPALAVLVGMAFVLVQGAMTLTLIGTLPARRAAVGALGLSLPMALLLGWAGMRFDPATDLMREPAAALMALLLALYAAPFLLVRLTEPPRWRTYTALFDAAWTMHLRFVLALVFAGLFWLLLGLSNELLKLVDVRIIGALLTREWLAFTLTGGLIGLGAAVVTELRGMITPFLFLRLLRLMVPVALVVVTVFLAAVPLRPLSALFGGLSAAATLMGTAIAAITLVSAALDQSDAAATPSLWMQRATRALAVLVLPLTGLAVWAVAQRVVQYGWTPDRVLAQTAAVLLFAYGAAYAVGAALRGPWMDRIRQANVALAGGVIGASALWMTPVLNPQQISTASQIARYADGRSGIEALPLWEMAHEWGKPGLAGLARLEDRGEAELSRRIALARDSTSRFRFRREAEGDDRPDMIARIVSGLVVMPGQKRLAPADLEGLPVYRLRAWVRGCETELPDGKAGCVLVLGRFDALSAIQRQGLMLYAAGVEASIDLVYLSGEGKSRVQRVRGTRQPVNPQLPLSAISEAQDGQFRLEPTGSQALWIGGEGLMSGN